MMLLDVVIDPLAVRGERWFLGHLFYYPNGGLYFGVPLSNFAGWWLVGTAGVGAYEACARPPQPGGGGRPEPGIALYYAVFLFNLALTGWIGEWALLGLGLALHGLTAAILVTIARRAPAGGVLATGRVQRA
jgi:putative membrane protein